ncbi:hypothetical protein EVA_11240 [gut metagenome]|uniref:Uncharacterized protein n=1 Tax=gut metagenome TaxID=749906 RepID=J9G0A6_9ZZZZ
MEDIFKILLVIGIIIYAFTIRTRKETPEMPNSDAPLMPEESPMPQDSYLKPAQETVIKPNRKTSSKPTHKEIKKHQPIQETQQTIAASTIGKTDKTSDYGIHTIEDAKRAFIWSEILQRKY